MITIKKKFSPWSGHLLAFVCGLCAVFGFAPYHYWIILSIAIGIFYLSLNSLGLISIIWRSFFFGVGFFGGGISWVYISIHVYGNTSVFLASCMTIILVVFLATVFFVPWCLLFKWLSRRLNSGNVLNIPLFASCWILGEWFRSCFLGGFPWLLTGYSLVDTPVAFLASITGTYGPGFLLVMVSASFAHWFFYSWQWQASFILALSVLAIFGTWPLKHIQWTQVMGKTLKFSAIQADIPQQLYWQKNYLENIVHTYLHFSHYVSAGEIVIWPENAIPDFYQNLTHLFKRLSQQMYAHNNVLVFGVPWKTEFNYYNAVAILGHGKGHYLKHKLVPFGEYIPFTILKKLAFFFHLPMSNFSSGSDKQPLLQIKGYPVATYICYDAIYANYVASSAHKSSFIIIINNDSWFGKSAGPWQHFQMIRMRAIETGRYIINVGNNSATALISPKGEILQKILPFRPGILKDCVQPVQGETFFMRYNSTPILLFCLLIIIFIGVRGYKKVDSQ